MTLAAEVRLWGRQIGAVLLPDNARTASFQYTPEFAASGIQVAPLAMPLSNRIYSFPALARSTFNGLPGLLADSLPDAFGNALIDAWLVREGRAPESFSAVERLCYVGTRGMGALEYRPVLKEAPAGQGEALEISRLVALASAVLTKRKDVRIKFKDADALTDILRVGTSAGGARAKAVVAWNPDTNELRSGQVAADSGYEHWLIKFDGVANNRDRELADPQGYGTIEYAYFLMARDCGITINECRLLKEGDRRHFMTRRFDRTSEGYKLHMQTLGALAHYDLNAPPGTYSYEQALHAIQQLDLGMEALEEQFRRMVFNLVGRNQDDHVKNIAFLMNKAGRWQLSPAYDLTYAYNPAGVWTARHQMSVNDKQEDFTRADLNAVANRFSFKRGRAEAMLEEVLAVFKRWPDYAGRAGVPDNMTATVQSNLRLEGW